MRIMITREIAKAAHIIKNVAEILAYLRWNYER